MAGLLHLGGPQVFISWGFYASQGRGNTLCSAVSPEDEATSSQAGKCLLEAPATKGPAPPGAPQPSGPSAHHTPRVRCMAESLQGEWPGYWGTQGPMAQAGLLPKLLPGVASVGFWLPVSPWCLPEPPPPAPLRNWRCPDVLSVAATLLTWDLEVCLLVAAGGLAPLFWTVHSSPPHGGRTAMATS